MTDTLAELVAIKEALEAELREQEEIARFADDAAEAIRQRLEAIGERALETEAELEKGFGVMA